MPPDHAGRPTSTPPSSASHIGCGLAADPPTHGHTTAPKIDPLKQKTTRLLHLRRVPGALQPTCFLLVYLIYTAGRAATNPSSAGSFPLTSKKPGAALGSKTGTRTAQLTTKTLINTHSPAADQAGDPFRQNLNSDAPSVFAILTISGLWRDDAGSRRPHRRHPHARRPLQRRRRRLLVGVAAAPHHHALSRRTCPGHSPARNRSAHHHLLHSAHLSARAQDSRGIWTDLPLDGGLAMHLLQTLHPHCDCQVTMVGRRPHLFRHGKQPKPSPHHRGLTSLTSDHRSWPPPLVALFLSSVSLDPVRYA